MKKRVDIITFEKRCKLPFSPGVKLFPIPLIVGLPIIDQPSITLCEREWCGRSSNFKIRFDVGSLGFNAEAERGGEAPDGIELIVRSEECRWSWWGDCMHMTHLIRTVSQLNFDSLLRLWHRHRGVHSGSNFKISPCVG